MIVILLFVRMILQWSVVPATKNIFAVFAVCEEEHVGLFVAQYEEFMTSDDVLLSVDSHCRKQSN